MNRNMDHIKLVVVGDGAVGKSCLLITWATGTFPSEYVPTVFDNYSSTINLNGKEVSLGLWDTAGQEDYDELRPLSYTGADIFLVCFSVANRNSFLNVKEKWILELRKYSPESGMVLVGTKTDLRRGGGVDENEGRDFVTAEEGRKMAKQLRMNAYVETSSLLNHGLKECFDTSFQQVVYGPKQAKSGGGGWGIFSALFGGSNKNEDGVRKPLPPIMPETGRAPFLNVDPSTYISDLQKLLNPNSGDESESESESDIRFVSRDEIGKDRTTSFDAHRIVLFVASEYFRNLFERAKKEEDEDVKAIELSDEELVTCYNLEEKTMYVNTQIQTDVFRKLLEFIYIGNFVGKSSSSSSTTNEVMNKTQRKELQTILKLLPTDLKEDIEKIVNNLAEMDSNPSMQEEERNFFRAVNHSFQTYIMDQRAGSSETGFRKFYDNEVFSDVTFVVGGDRVRVHKPLLFCRSEYFKTMLTSNFIESQQEEVEILEDEGVYTEFKYFLEYLYTSHTYDFLNNENALKMLSLSNKFGNDRFVSFCEIYVSKLVERECREKIEKSAIDVIGILIFAHHHEAKQLEKFCLHFIASNYQCFKRREEWGDLQENKELFEYVEKHQWPPKTYLREVKKYQKELNEYYKKIGKKVPKKEINFLKKDILEDIEKYEMNEEDLQKEEEEEEEGEEEEENGGKLIEKKTKNNRVEKKKKSKGWLGFLF